MSRNEMTEQEFYNHLIRISERYTILVNAILDSSELNYNGKDLTFTDSVIRPVLKVLEFESYTDKLQALQEEKQRKDEAKPEPMD